MKCVHPVASTHAAVTNVTATPAAKPFDDILGCNIDALKTFFTFALSV